MNLTIALLLAPPSHASEAFGDSIFYVGDLHAHTGYSGDAGSSDIRCGMMGGCGAFADVFDDARANGMDFLALSDHVNGFRTMSAAQWLTLHAAVLAANDPSGGFVTIPAGELWFYDGPIHPDDGLGHKTLLMFGDDASLAPVTLTDVRPMERAHLSSCQDVWDWADTLSAAYGDIFLIPHHPATAAPLWTEWDCHDPVYEPAIEIYSRHGNSLEGDSAYDVPGAGVTVSGYASNAIDPDNFAFTAGFLGGTDAHDTRPGETCATDAMQPSHLYGGGLTILVLDASETFDRPAIRDAIEDRRSYTTTGPVLTPLLRYEASGVEVGGLGSLFTIESTEDLVVNVELPSDQAAFVDEVLAVGPTGSWTMTGDGATTWTVTIPAGDVPGYVYVRIELDGDAWYGAGVCVDGGSDAIEYVWSSPAYVTVLDDDLDDDGWLNTDDCDSADATVHPGATEVWYDGVDQDCDGWSDHDMDGDGFDAPSGGGDDCDDADATINEDAEETWYDGVDQDCDHAYDYDADGDGHEPPPHGTDCDDAEWSVNQDALDTPYDGVDSDCDGVSDYDADQDGFDSDKYGGDDCDDTSSYVAPGLLDLWTDGVDEDCDGADGPVAVAAEDIGSATEEADDTGALEPGTSDTGALEPGTSDTGTAGAWGTDDTDEAASDDTGAALVSPDADATDTDASDAGADTGDTAAEAAPSPGESITPDRPRRHRPPGPPLRPGGRRPPRPPLNPDGSRPELPVRP